ncbi:hypothetical protein DMN77_12450 [Paenibacillus sp. 79R4]|uniref:hypothetical protein n=1 Tax=Paenibacillus sp. 79R4 TaxID=2212847 RepID=UPI0015BF0B9F|nr:hypothetical protein [Paenibacillus sp. 79R4]NWL88398.1 hypothetical protein [Paenibacillus sp. 79R4]
MTNKRRSYIIINSLVILFVMSACMSTKPENKFKLYEGKSLRIAVIGEPPQIKEEQVNFREISFDDLNKGELKNIEYEETWDWTPGTIYAVGSYKSNEDHSLKSWGLALYNNEKTDENIKNLYSRIFTKIEELDS